MTLLQQPECLLSIFGDVHREAHVMEHALPHLLVDDVVFNQQYPEALKAGP
jgi:hypothetical protein